MSTLVVVETVPSNVDVAELGKYSACGTLLVLCEVLRQWDYVLRRHPSVGEVVSHYTTHQDLSQDPDSKEESETEGSTKEPGKLCKHVRKGTTAELSHLRSLKYPRMRKRKFLRILNLGDLEALGNLTM